MKPLLLLLVGALALAAWASRRTRRPIFTHLVLLRFPILVGAVLAGLPFAASESALLGNLFALDFAGLAAVAALATVAGWVVASTAELVLRYGALRLSDDEAATAATGRAGGLDLGLSPAAQRLAERARPWVAAALAAPSLAVALLGSADDGRALAAAGVATGVAVGAGLLFAAMAVEKRFVADPGDPRVLPDFGGALDRWLVLDPPRLARAMLGVAERLAARRPFGPGYLEPPPAPGAGIRRRLLPGHLANVCLLAMSGLVYLAVGALQFPGWSGGRLASDTPAAFAHLPAPGSAASGLLASWFPAYGYLLLLLIVLGWMLPGLSFLLDRYRLPVLAPVVLAWAVGFTFAGGDHVFPVVAAPRAVPSAASAPAAAEPALAERVFGASEAGGASGAGGPVVIVAAAGGGITSARWTAEVLTRLAEDPRFGGALLDRLGAISAVSGGALGALYLVDRLPAGRAAPGGALAAGAGAAVRRAAGASSLEPVTWGLAYPDLARGGFAPLATWLFPRHDRSWALESSWSRRLAPSAGRIATLGSWRDAAIRGERPFTIFNATAVETGERFQLSTVLPADRPGVGNFLRDFPGHDLPIVSAVRLAATFPLVTQAARASARPARAEPGGTRLSGAHFVDGGYYDNSGVLSALELLEDALADRQRRTAAGDGPPPPPPIVLLRVRAFETTPAELAAERGDDPWLVSVLSPATTVVRVRAATQVYRNEFEAELFRAKWRARGVPVFLVDVPLHARGPLSWKLTAAERCAIDREWRERWSARRPDHPCLALLDALLAPPAERSERSEPSEPAEPADAFGAPALDALERACREQSARAARQPEAPPCVGDPDAPAALSE